MLLETSAARAASARPIRSRSPTSRRIARALVTAPIEYRSARACRVEPSTGTVVPPDERAMASLWQSSGGVNAGS